MRPVLHDIVERKRRDVAARKHALDPRPASGRAGVFRAALARPGARFILEAKRRSPSLGDLRPALDAATIVSAYSGIADAISVVTDEPFFGGSLELLAEVRARCTLPLLCKDFVVDPYQVGEAAHHGADAILLMMSVLDDGDARACLAEAERHGLDALVEVHDEIELGRALALGASIVGINHRSFRDLSIDLTLSGRLAPRIPAGVVVIAESGIAGASDVDRIAPHVDAFLVGSLLMKEPDLRGAAAALVFGRVKICGLTNAADAVLAARSGAAQLGLVFADGARRVTPAEARAIAIAASRPVVGVFRDQTVEVIVATVRDLGLAGVQLHGSESDASVLQLRPKTRWNSRRFLLSCLL